MPTICEPGMTHREIRGTDIVTDHDARIDVRKIKLTAPELAGRWWERGDYDATADWGWPEPPETGAVIPGKRDDYAI